MEKHILDIMRKKLVITAIILSCNALMAQDDGNQDTTRIQIGDTRIVIYNAPELAADTLLREPDSAEVQELQRATLTHWGGIDLGVNFLLDPDRSMDFSGENEWLNIQNERSYSLDINVYEQKIRLVGDYFGIITGMGAGFRSFSFRDSVMLVSNGDTTLGAYNPDITYRSNKLRTTHAKIPLLLEVNSSKDNKKCAHIAFGVTGGWRILSLTRQVYEIEDKRVKTKARGDYNLSPLTLDASVRVGYRNFTLFANYGLTPFFQDGKGAEVYPLTIGLALASW